MKDITGTLGCWHINFPTSEACFLEQVTTLNTPGGIPASSAISARAKALRGVSSAGLHTTVQPAANAAPTWD